MRHCGELRCKSDDDLLCCLFQMRHSTLYHFSNTHNRPHVVLTKSIPKRGGRFFFNSFFVGVGELLVHKRERKAKEKEKTKFDGGTHDRRRRSVKGGENIFWKRRTKRRPLFKSLLLSLAIFFFFRLETPFSFCFTCFNNLQTGGKRISH